MPKDNNLYSNFFKNKTIQKTDKFLVTIEPTIWGNFNQWQQRLLVNMENRTGPMPKIESHHVVNIVVPNFEFKREQNGWNSFPSFDFQGFEFSIMFEEDQNGTIAKFINWCIRRTADDAGYHFPTSINRIGSIMIEALTDHDVPIYAYEFRNCYFLRNTPLTYDYTSNTAQKISVTFGAEDNIFYENDTLEADIRKKAPENSWRNIFSIGE